MEGKKMKRVMIINLWMLMMGWCLYFSNMMILGTTLLTIVLIANLYLFNKVNYWRFIFIFTLISIFNLAVIYSLKMPYSLLSLPFLLLVGLNLSYVNEISYLLKKSFIKSVHSVVLLVTVCFMMVALVIPYSPLLPNYKTNLYGYILMMFSFPLINYSTCLLARRRKEACIIKTWNL